MQREIWYGHGQTDSLNLNIEKLQENREKIKQGQLYPKSKLIILLWRIDINKSEIGTRNR